MRNALFVAVVIALPATAAPPLAIRNATVETLSTAGRIEKATVVIRDGKIEAVGKSVAIPEDASVIDAAGGTVMPGIIDPHFEVAVASGTPEAAARTIVIGGRTITLGGGMGIQPQVFTRIADNFYPYDTGFKPLPRIGLTRLNLVTNGSGQSAIVRVTPADPELMMDRPDGCAFLSLTNNSTSLDQLRSRLDPGQRGGGRGAGGGGRFGGGGASTVGNQLWTDVRDGKAPLIVACANSATIVHVLKIVEPHKSIKLTLFAAAPAFAEAADAIKGRPVRALLRPGIDILPNSRDRFAAARMLNDLGIEVAFSLSANPPSAGAGIGAIDPTGPQATATESTLHDDFPLFPVAVMVKAGLPRQVALEALSKRNAQLLGIEAIRGSVEPGKAADLVLFNGDPLDLGSRLRLTLIDGRTVHAID
jgi:hypothetical protein